MKQLLQNALAFWIFTRLSLADLATGQACSSEVDCQLNGVCLQDKCYCRVPWKGENCELLDVQPALRVPAYGSDIVSWGGNAVEYGGEWHLFVAEMTGGCKICEWTTNSQVRHAVAESSAGPFHRSDLALPPSSSNPQVLRQDYRGETTLWLFTIGFYLDAWPFDCPPKNHTFCGGHIKGPKKYWVYKSGVPTGPWLAVGTSLPSCNNPSPWWDTPTETWYLLCGTRKLYTNASPDLADPWTQIGELPWPSNEEGRYDEMWEDGFLWIDFAHNFHVLAHVYNGTGPCGLCNDARVSGHQYSKDGTQWTRASTKPFQKTIQFEDGTHHVFSTLERPKLIFDSTGHAVRLMVGASPVETCAPVAAANCKYNDTTVTLSLPLAQEAEFTEHRIL